MTRKEQTRAARKRYLDRNREQVNILSSKSQLKQRYGITQEQYDTLLTQQNNLCAICKGEETKRLRGKLLKLSVDHCHKTGRVRGLLCSACNRGLGCFYDDAIKLAAATCYIVGDC